MSLFLALILACSTPPPAQAPAPEATPEAEPTVETAAFACRLGVELRGKKAFVGFTRDGHDDGAIVVIGKDGTIRGTVAKGTKKVELRVDGYAPTTVDTQAGIDGTLICATPPKLLAAGELTVTVIEGFAKGKTSITVCGRPLVPTDKGRLETQVPAGQPCEVFATRDEGGDVLVQSHPTTVTVKQGASKTLELKLP